MSEAFAKRDLFCRAGSTTIAELTVAGKAAILVPLARRRRSPDLERESTRRAGCGAPVSAEAELETPPGLFPDLVADPAKVRPERCARSLGKPGCAARVADMLLRVGERGMKILPLPGPFHFVGIGGSWMSPPPRSRAFRASPSRFWMRRARTPRRGFPRWGVRIHHGHDRSHRRCLSLVPVKESAGARGVARRGLRAIHRGDLLEAVMALPDARAVSGLTARRPRRPW